MTKLETVVQELHGHTSTYPESRPLQKALERATEARSWLQQAIEEESGAPEPEPPSEEA